MSSSVTKLIVGVCAMDVKARGKPMRNILDRLLSFNDVEVVLFGDHVILEESIEDWPRCDVLIAFFSKGFPLDKAVAYAKLRRPFCVNDLLYQYLLLDRRLVLTILDAIDVTTPIRLTVNRDKGPKLPIEVIDMVSRDFNVNLAASHKLFPREELLMIDQDTIKVGENVLRKPFLEKPVDAEDHNIYIYYPQEMGGGCRKLFRKVSNKSSEFFPNLTKVRQEGSFIYEPFLEAEHAEDVKIYTVGLHYAHAETRKAPAVDGIVRRNAEGKELRRVTEMTNEEQEIARRVCMAFGQTICGFDIIRTKERSYVVDVNGWSFVKGNATYMEKCADILRDTFYKANIVGNRRSSWKYESSLSTAIEGQWKLKAFISIFRHGDRTPKQKLKITVNNDRFFELLPMDYAGEEDLVIRDKEIMSKALTIARSILTEQQCKLEKETVQLSNERQKICRYETTRLEQLVEVLSKKIKIPGTKLQIRGIVKGENPSAMLIVKWGGDYTHAGRHHTKDLGESMRKELLILNRSILDNIRVFCSAERRVSATAEVFVKALLSIAEVAPNYINVLKDVLDDSFVSKSDIYTVKRRIGERLILKNKGIDNLIIKDNTLSINDGSNGNDDPIQLLKRLRACLALHQKIMHEKLKNPQKLPRTRWCCSDSINLFRERWEKHFADILVDKKVEEKDEEWFDPSRISDLYDSLKFDALHHQSFLEAIFTDDSIASKSSFNELYLLAQKLFDFVAPREYGTTSEEILRIGKQISGLLMKRILIDLQSALDSPMPYARLYFTKESHMTALLNILKNCGLPLTRQDPNIEPCSNELDYLSHICFELYEKQNVDANNGKKVKYSMRIGLSAGAHNSRLLDLQLDARHALEVRPKRWLTDYLEGMKALDILNQTIGNIEFGLSKADGKYSEPMTHDAK